MATWQLGYYCCCRWRRPAVDAANGFTGRGRVCGGGWLQVKLVLLAACLHLLLFPRPPLLAAVAQDSSTKVEVGVEIKQLVTDEWLNNGHHQQLANEAAQVVLGRPVSVDRAAAYHLPMPKPNPPEEREEEEIEEEDVLEEEQQDDYNDYGAYIIYDTAASSLPGGGGVMQSAAVATGERQVSEPRSSLRPAALIFFAATPRAPAASPAAGSRVAAKMDHGFPANQSRGAFKAGQLSTSNSNDEELAAGSMAQAGVVAHEPVDGRLVVDQSSGGASEEIKEPLATQFARGSRARRHPPATGSPVKQDAASSPRGEGERHPLEAARGEPPCQEAHDIKWLRKMNGRRRLADGEPSKDATLQSSEKQTGRLLETSVNDKGDYIEGIEQPVLADAKHMLVAAPSNQASGDGGPNLGASASTSLSASNHGRRSVQTETVAQSSTTRLFHPNPYSLSQAMNDTSKALLMTGLLANAGSSEHLQAAYMSPNNSPAAATRWLGNPETNSSTHNVYYWRLIWFILPLGATFGNLLVIIAVYLERSLQSVTNYFIVSLAFADLFVGLIVMPFAVYVLVNEVWELSDTICDIFVAVDVTSSTASILNLVAISIDRYRAVAYPIAYTAGSSSTIAVLTICGVWLISSAVGTPIMFGLNTTPNRRSDVCILYNSTFIFWSSLASFYIPCMVMIALYWRVFSAIRSRTKKALQASTVGGSSNQPHQYRKQTGTTLENQRQVQEKQQQQQQLASLAAPQNTTTHKLPSSSAPHKSNSAPPHNNNNNNNNSQPNTHEAPHQAHSSIKSPSNGPKCPLRRILCAQADCEEQRQQLKSLSINPAFHSHQWQLVLKPLATCHCNLPSSAGSQLISANHQLTTTNLNTCSSHFLSKLCTSTNPGSNLRKTTTPLSPTYLLADIASLLGFLSRATTLNTSNNLSLLKANSSTVVLPNGLYSVSLEFDGTCLMGDASAVKNDTTPLKDLPEQLAPLASSHASKILLSERCCCGQQPPANLQHQPGILLCLCCQGAIGREAPVMPPPVTICLLEPLPFAAAAAATNEQLPPKLNKITLLSSSGNSKEQASVMMIAYVQLNLKLTQDTSQMICIYRWPVSECSEQEFNRVTLRCRQAHSLELCETCLAKCSVCSVLELISAEEGSQLREPTGSVGAISAGGGGPLKEAGEKCVHLSRLLEVERAIPRHIGHHHHSTKNHSECELTPSEEEEVSREDEDGDVECKDAMINSNSSPSPTPSSSSTSSSSSTNFRFGSDFYSGSSTNQLDCHVHRPAARCFAGGVQATSGHLEGILCASCSHQQQQQQRDLQLAPSSDCHSEEASQSEVEKVSVGGLPVDESMGRRQKARFDGPEDASKPEEHRKSSSLSGRRPTGGELLIAGPTGKQERLNRQLANQQQAANLLQNATRTIKRRSMRLTQLIRGKRRTKQSNNNGTAKEQVDNNSTPEATNSEVEDVYSSSLAPFGSSALAGKSCTLLSSHSTTTPTTTTAAVAAKKPALQLVPEQVKVELAEGANCEEEVRKRSLTQVVVASAQQQQQQLDGQFDVERTKYQVPAVEVVSKEQSKKQQQNSPITRNKPQSQRHRVAGSKRRREKNAAKRERKATKTLAIVLGIFLICWTPFFTCNIIDGVCIQLEMDCRPGMVVYTITSWLGYINSCVNPIIYTIFNMEFRRAFKKIICIRSR